MGPDTFSALLGAVYRRRLTVLLVLAGSLGTAWWFLGTVPPMYQARASLFVRSETPELSLSSAGSSLPAEPVLPDMSEQVRVGLMGIASSNSVYERVLERLPELSLRELRKRVVLDIDPSQQLLVLAVDADRARAVQIANEYTVALAGLMSEMSERHPLTTLAALRKEEPAAQRAYLEAQDAMLSYLTAVGSPDPEQDLLLLVQERQDLRDALADIDLLEQRSAAQLPVVERQLDAQPEFVLARQTVTESAAYRGALNEVAAVRTELAVARTRYLEAHPRVLELEQQLTALEQRVREEAERGMEQLQAQYEPDPQAQVLMGRLVEMQVAMAGVEPARADLSGRLQQVEASLQAMPLNQAELARLDHGVQVSKAHLLRVTERVAELELQLERGIEPVYYDPDNLAQEDQLVELPSTAGVMSFAAIAGLLGGLLLAMISELIASARRQLPF